MDTGRKPIGKIGIKYKPLGIRETLHIEQVQ